MKELDFTGEHVGPVVIGGVGGSGTRLIAQCLGELGYFMGHDLNEAIDNLWFTFLFNRAEILSSSEEEFGELLEIFFKGMTGSGGFTDKQIDLINSLAATGQDTDGWLRKRLHALLSRARGRDPKSWREKMAHSLLTGRPGLQPGSRWGWKEPNAHIVLDRLKEYFQDMKYIHVARNGLDMAHSHNQNQLKLWGRHFIGEDFSISPRYSLKYWCIIHRRVLEIGQSMGANFLFLNYDQFCSNPEDGISELSGFLAVDSESVPVTRLLGLVNPPDSVGRFRQHGTEIFYEDDVAYVSELGFDIGESEHGRHA